MNTFQKHYNQKAEDYKISAPRFEKILEICTDLKNKKVLDVGCATGYLGKEFAKRGAEVTGIDIAKAALKKASEVLSFVKLVDLNDGKLPFKDKTFDLIVASEVIEHLFKPSIILKEFKRVLKDDGKLIITTPNLLYWGHRLKFLIGRFGYTEEGPFDVGHIHFYTYQTLTGDLHKSGFRIVKENHVYAKGNIISLLKNAFPGIFAYQFVIKVRTNGQ